MKNQILLKKVKFVHHLATLPENTLGREFYEIQLRNEIPSVVNECHKYFEEWKIGDITKYSKFSFKRLMNGFLYEKNREDLLGWMRGYKKISYATCSKETHEMRDYFRTLSIEQCRIRF